MKPLNFFYNLGGVRVPACEAANSFAAHFRDKIRLNVMRSKVEANTVYNGKCKLIVQNRFYYDDCELSLIVSNSNVEFVLC